MNLQEQTKQLKQEKAELLDWLTYMYRETADGYIMFPMPNAAEHEQELKELLLKHGVQNL